MANPQQQAHVLAQRIQAQVMRAAGKGVLAAAVFLAARVKEELSVPAPRKKLKGGGYRATTRATPGAPPRKLSGRQRGSVFRRQVSETAAVVGVNARSVKGFDYPKFWEIRQAGHPRSGSHPFLLPTVLKYLRELRKIIGRTTAGR